MRKAFMLVAIAFGFSTFGATSGAMAASGETTPAAALLDIVSGQTQLAKRVCRTVNRCRRVRVCRRGPSRLRCRKVRRCATVNGKRVCKTARRCVRVAGPRKCRTVRRCRPVRVCRNVNG